MAETGNGLQEKVNNLNHKLDEILILISKRFHVRIPADCFLKSTLESILAEAGVLSITSGLQQVVDKSAEAD